MNGPDPNDLVRCLPIRLTLELERGIREHQAYLQRRNHRHVSLAETCRDLFARALQFSPTRVGERRRRGQRSGQLPLTFTPKGVGSPLRSATDRAEERHTPSTGIGGENA